MISFHYEKKIYSKINYNYPWTIISNYNEYSLIKSNISDNSNISIAFSFYKEEEKLIIPFIYKNVYLGPPYDYGIGILSNYNEIKDIKGYFEINGKEKINLDLIYDNFIEIKDKKRFLFNSKTLFNYDRNEINDIKLILEYIGVNDLGEEKNMEEVIISKQYFHFFGNYLLKVIGGI